MKDNVTTLLTVVAAAAAIAAGIWLLVYKWHDCRKVGHSALYCVMDLS